MKKKGDIVTRIKLTIKTFLPYNITKIFKKGKNTNYGKKRICRWQYATRLL